MSNGMAPNWLPEKPARIAVAMSGGVDSSVVAHLLAKAGHELIGLTAWTLNGPGTCCNDALVNAGRVCDDLGIPFDSVDLRAEFSHYVMDYYHRSYQAGLTPNPCVECNRYVKWEALLAYAVNELGVDYVATGHYVNLGRAGDGWQDPVSIYRPLDVRKDQTYMLARVLPQDLQRALFPLGNWRKPDVVAHAKALNIPTAYSKESMDVCFVLNGQADYLQGVLGKKPGPVVDMDTGQVIGEHEGYFQFTQGQRKGVKVAAGRPVYVIKTDAETNTVYVGDAKHLQSSFFEVVDVNWVVPELPNGQGFDQGPFEAMVQTRYSSQPVLAQVSPLPKHAEQPVARYLVTCYASQSAVTPGQIAAFYCPDNRQLWGGGYIERHLTHPVFDASQVTSLPDLHCSAVRPH
ncbi:MAG: tRNA 2-thiouridine(34) synthase MnmA [Candidatus Melainabacteria bacterium]|nr:tRNA 2-thiouridine(34) synthase MnmA [Candidatus Melainabacteria bacterium]